MFEDMIKEDLIALGVTDVVINEGDDVEVMLYRESGAVRIVFERNDFYTFGYGKIVSIIKRTLKANKIA